ncbi:DUF924 family protein [Bradyrhizobium sp. SYSU BS000235]|uniref:DUF924 family protein n=1 Tax=Bradyrhizobium sp. SYSU BS000235 TaxID=3411332 RepID=UPI003C779E38
MSKQDVSPEDVLNFWRAAGPDRWWTKDIAFDAEVRDRFTHVWNAARGGQLSAWQASDNGALALVIALDQFPRNIFRNDPRAFSTDAIALEVASRAIAEGRDNRIEADLRVFVYLPFMHSENLADQERCVELLSQSGDAENLKYAEVHADIIRTFGRFPHRNPILGREMKSEEAAFLESGGFAG